VKNEFKLKEKALDIIEILKKKQPKLRILAIKWQKNGKNFRAPREFNVSASF